MVGDARRELASSLAPRRRGEWLWAPLLYTALALLLYRTVWTGRGYLGWDMLESYWGDLGFIATAFRQGEWPMWNPYERFGYAFHADPQSGAHYPLSWLLAVVGALLGDTPAWLIQVKALAHFVLLGALMHLYLRSRRLPVVAAVFGGVLAVASGPMIWHKASNVAWPMVWAPLVWLAIDRAVEGARSRDWWRRSALLAAAVLLPAVAGSPHGFFHVVLAGGAYGCFRAVQALRAGTTSIGRLALSVGVAVAAAAPILALVYLGTGDLVAHSPRAVRTLGYALDGGLYPGHVLAGWLTPRFGILGVYNGVLMPAFAVVALLAAPRADRWAPLFFVGFAACFVVLASGPFTPVLRFLVEHVPGFGLFRVPPRYTILANVALIVAAAHGAAALHQDAGRRLALVALGCLAAIAAALLGIRLFASPPASLAISFLAVAIAAVPLVAPAVAPARRRGLVVIVLAALTFVDVARALDPLLRITERPPSPATRRALDGLDGVRTEWRVVDEFLMEFRSGSRYGVREVRGYIAGDPLEDVRYQTLVRGGNAQLLEAFNVRWILHGPHHRHGTDAHNLKRPPAPPHWKRLDDHRFEANHPVPLIAWYGAVRIVGGPGETLAAIAATEAPDGTRRRVVVEANDIPPGVDLSALKHPRPLVPGKLLSYGLDRIAFTIDAPADGLVVLNEKFFPGWHVTVDGQPAIPIRASWLLRGVLVPAGQHEVVWTYRPDGQRPLAVGSLVSAVFLLVAAVRRRD